MKFENITLKSSKELSEHIKNHQPTLFLGSQTSTVIPYGFLEGQLKDKDLSNGCETFYLADLSQMASGMEVIEGDKLFLKGAVSWQMASEFLQNHQRVVKTYPTENLAQICAGVATSCTGERSFGFGTLRSQIINIKYIDWQGEEVLLSRDKSFSLEENQDCLISYQEDFVKYKNLKNAPFPRFEKETDLMVGTEGQLGVVTEVTLETGSYEQIQYLFVKLPRWEKDFAPHLEIFSSVQGRSQSIYSCELTDYNSMKDLNTDDRIHSKSDTDEFDVIFLEIPASKFEEIYEEVICKWSLVDMKDVFEISGEKFQNLRSAIPRTLFERNSQRGILKKGTDVQVNPKKFCELLEFYRCFSQEGIEYNLFGHFGDAHLHFNFLPTQEQQSVCDELLLDLYAEVERWEGSPFAEHGIGLLKQPFIKNFYGQNQYDLFASLKKSHDPYNQFFPQGFMT